MHTPFKTAGLVSAATLLLSLSAHTATATDYQGNRQAGFDGAVGNGLLSLTSDGTTLTGTITNGNTRDGFNDTLVIYIDSVTGGFGDTSSFTDSGDPAASDNLRASISGYNGTSRAPLSFASGFAADYAIALGPNSANFGALFTLSTGAFTYNGNANLTPTNTGTNATYTFSLPFSLFGSPNSFKFATTYLSGGTAVVNGNQTSAYRSNEAYGNTITDLTAPGNTGNVGNDTGSVGFSTFVVPEPSTWAMMVGGVALMVGALRRRWLRAA